MTEKELLSEITKESIEQAIKEIDKTGIRKGRHSSTYDLVYNGKKYPPKLVLSIANRFSNGNELDPNLFEGGKDTPAFELLQEKGFVISSKTDKVQSLIENYKKHIAITRLKNEVYKWEAVKQFEGRPNTNALDFTEEIKEVDHKNLVYAMSKAVLRNLAKREPEKLRDFFKFLFDEKVDLKERVLYFNATTKKLYKELGETLSHHQDERSIAAYLTYYDPQKYTFYKSSFYKKYCKLIGVKEAKKNEKYVHYLQLINELIKNYIEPDTELKDLVKSLIPDFYDGTNNLLLAQDIFYQMLDKEEINDSESDFIKVKNQLDNDKYEIFIATLKSIVGKFNLDRNDSKLAFNVRPEKSRLVFIIGNRYALSIEYKKKKTSFGITTDKILSEDNGEFRNNNGEIEAYWNNVDDIQGFEDELMHGCKVELNRDNKSPFNGHSNQDFMNVIFEDHNNAEENNIMVNTQNINFALNTILYGPPGTGKTYNTLLRAAEIIENRKIENYNEAKKIFKENLHDRIEFITFHQNYSYEDFIQGLRPDTENDKQLTFERKDGVFKVIADKALKNLRDSEEPKNAKRSFEDIFGEFISPLIEGEVEEIEVKMKMVSYFITGISNKSIEFRKASGGSNHTLSINTLSKMYEAESVSAIVGGLATYYTPLLEALLKKGKFPKGVEIEVSRKNFVIIIDEINRANISRVFGELITLIEPDKRSHGAIPLEARLPSGDKFMVPSNLFIIGTMNTADKSIALLDIALRRRFEFEAMYPKYQLNGYEIYDKEILIKINEQIIKSKGHDFQIGHAYFMGENKNLVQRMNYKVIPLLLEYYMNDEKEVKGILINAGLELEENSWPLKIIGKRD